MQVLGLREEVGDVGARSDLAHSDDSVSFHLLPVVAVTPHMLICLGDGAILGPSVGSVVVPINDGRLIDEVLDSHVFEQRSEPVDQLGSVSHGCIFRMSHRLACVFQLAAPRNDGSTHPSDDSSTLHQAVLKILLVACIAVSRRYVAAIAGKSDPSILVLNHPL